MPTRRVIRKVRSRAHDTFDDQMWPVNVAIALLGGFSAGVTAAYLDFADPRPLYNAWTSILAIAVLTIGVMIAMRWVSNRLVRRGMQLSLVLAALLHLMFVVAAHGTDVFGQVWTEETAQQDLTRRRQPVTVQDYVQLPRDENQPQDFEQPIETETPAPEPEEVEREQPKQEEVAEVQPQPEPERQPTMEPRPTERSQPTESAPRASQTLAKMSRHSSERIVQAATPSPNSQSSPQRTASPRTAPTPTKMTRMTASSAASPAASTAEPSSSARVAASSTSRSETQRQAQPQTNARAAVERNSAQPNIAATTQVTPSPRARRSEAESEIAAAATPVRRQNSSSPETNRTPREVEPSRTVAESVERRRIDNPTQPQVASSNQPSPNSRPRLTTRPDAAVAVEVNSANPNSRSETATAEAQPQATAIATRQATSTPTPLRRVEPQATPLQPSTRPARRTNNSPTPVMESIVRSTPRRAVDRSSPTPVNNAAATPTAVTRQATDTTASAQSLAVRKQQTANEHAAPNESASVAAATGSRPATTASRSSAPRRQAEANPVAQSSAETARTRSRTVASAMRMTSPNAVAAADRAPSSAEQTQLQASSTQVARQQAAPASAQGSASSETTASANARANVGSSSASRQASQSSNPNVASNQPSRQAPSPARTAVAIASSSPAVAVPTAGSRESEASVEPTAIALNRGESGIAGGADSPNLDRSSPAASTPSQVASASARRAMATQDSPQGPSLRPQAPALTRNSRAMAERSTSMFSPQAVTLANASASERVAEADASAAATVERAMSNAENASITAAAGATEVDLGPTRVVSESGAARSRSAGGGQPEISVDGQTQPNRRRSQGSPDLAVNAEVAPAGGSPAAETGGASQNEPAAVAAASLDRRSEDPGEPSTSAGERAAAAEAAASMASELGSTQLARAEQGDQVAEPVSSSGDDAEDDEEDEEKRRARLLAARLAGGGPQLAIAGSRVAPEAAMAAPNAGDATSPASAAAAPAGGEIARLDNTGAPAEVAIADAGGGQPASTATGSAQAARAEAADGNVGAPTIGGGSPTLSRRSGSPAFAAASAAESIEVAGAPDAGGGADRGAAIAAANVQVGKQSGAAENQPNANLASGEQGGAAGGDVAATNSGRAGGAAGGGPAVGGGQVAAMSRSGSRSLEASDGMLTVEAPSPGDIPVAVLDGPSPRAGDQSAGIRRQASGSITVANSAMEGPGGLGAVAALDAGINSRRAQRESVQVHTRPARYLKKDSGGQLSTNPNVVVAAEAFQGRNIGGRSQSLGPQTEKAVELGLSWLARHQLENGGWSLQGYPEETQMNSDTAATGLALLAFQGAGYHHLDYEYRANCDAAIRFLVANQKENGDLYIPMDEYSNSAVWLYSHGIAALALTEAYGMTQDPKLKDPAQRALNFIVYSQDRAGGGWRYAPQAPGDTSVSGWMVMALKSGELAGLEVPKETYDRVNAWLDKAAAGQYGEKYRYNPEAPDTPTQRHGRTPTTTMTAVGQLLRFYSGHNRNSQSMKRGAMYLLDRLPGADDASVYDARRDTYYWYYATQVMFHMKGDYWEKWNSTLRPLLLQSQVQQGSMAGSWDPLQPVPDRWGAHAGRLYVTAMNLLSLEVRFRHMPLNEFTGRD